MEFQINNMNNARPFVWFERKRFILNYTKSISMARNRNIIKAITTAVSYKLINILSGFIIVPLTLNYLGVDLFGIWMTLMSLVGFLNFTDCGMGIGLQNALSKCHGKNDLNNPKKYISSTFIMLSIIFIVLFLMAIIVIPVMPVKKLVRGSNDHYANQILPTIQAIVIVFSLGLPIGLIQRILNGYQKQHVTNILLIIGRLLSIGGLAICILLNQSLNVMSAIFIVGPSCVMLVYSIYFFYSNKWMRPSFKSIDYKCIYDLAVTGFWSLLSQLAHIIRLNIPTLLISSTIGSLSVASFTTTQKLVGASGMLMIISLQSLWPAYSDAFYRRDKRWMKSTFRSSIKILLIISTPIFFIIAIYGRAIIRFWIGHEAVVPTWSLLMACNIWSFLLLLNVATSMVLNGSNHLKCQATYGLLLSSMACIIAYFVGDRHGASGIIWCVVIVGEGILLPVYCWEALKIIDKA
jgi:O-antigen/teichoic acid export membrane protein